MNDETARAGANPAKTAPSTAQFEALSANAVNRAVALAVVHIEETLISSKILLVHCDQLANAPRDQSLAAVRSAVRLLRNHSDAAQALARVARGETRHRTIVEYARDADPDGRLNSNFFGSPPPPARARQSNAKSTGKPNGKSKANGHAPE